ncbi:MULTISPECIES: alpha/beta hydrolase family protein [Sphingobacterium]|uniref:alpha/beta hydrolase family protein n=1 Tax=Sphingobacterium TaxID=28453 RepID=UPI00257A9CA7|nr:MULTISPECIES: prolyl oligopeptidase family serine peptidase [Sphingobacterium]
MDISKKRIYILIDIAVIAFILGRLAARASIKPISAFKWINQNSVPTVCAYGVYDKICPFNSVKHLIKALKDHHVPHEYIEFPHSGHALQNDDKKYITYMQKVEEYLNAYMPLNS